MSHFIEFVLLCNFTIRKRQRVLSNPYPAVGNFVGNWPSLGIGIFSRLLVAEEVPRRRVVNVPLEVVTRRGRWVLARPGRRTLSTGGLVVVPLGNRLYQRGRRQENCYCLKEEIENLLFYFWDNYNIVLSKENAANHEEKRKQGILLYTNCYINYSALT